MWVGVSVPGGWGVVCCALSTNQLFPMTHTGQRVDVTMEQGDTDLYTVSPLLRPTNHSLLFPPPPPHQSHRPILRYLSIFITQTSSEIWNTYLFRASYFSPISRLFTASSAHTDRQTVTLHSCHRGMPIIAPKYGIFTRFFSRPSVSPFPFCLRKLPRSRDTNRRWYFSVFLS